MGRDRFRQPVRVSPDHSSQQIEVRPGVRLAHTAVPFPYRHLERQGMLLVEKMTASRKSAMNGQGTEAKIRLIERGTKVKTVKWKKRICNRYMEKPNG